MTITIESDLKEVLAKIEQRLDKLDQKLDNLSNEVTGSSDNSLGYQPTQTPSTISYKSLLA